MNFCISLLIFVALHYTSSEPLRYNIQDLDDYPKFKDNTGETTRVVGGELARSGDAPYQISMRYKDGTFHFCGGSIIDPQWILTAAHCVTEFKPHDIEVVAGTLSLTDGGDHYAVEKIVKHEFYNPRIIRNDIALLKLASPITFNDQVRSIQLCDHSVDGGQQMLLTGWGLTSFPGNVSKELKRAELKSISNAQCAIQHFVEVNPPVSFFNNICTLNGKDEGACKGDSGGPLVEMSSGQLCGVVSWGSPCAKGAPDVFTRVSAFANWIRLNMK